MILSDTTNRRGFLGRMAAAAVAGLLWPPRRVVLMTGCRRRPARTGASSIFLRPNGAQGWSTF